jgi:aspartate/methionine/tyrosine aminotransferase
MVAGLRAIGLGVGVEPTGAFYVFADARRFSARSYDLAFEILTQARVAVTPGIDFGSGGEGYLRFSYANSLPRIREALARMGEFLRDRRAPDGASA